MKHIGIVGSRRRKSVFDRNKLENQFWVIYEEDDWIVSGGCPEGGDKFAEDIAKEYGIPIIIFYPYWKKFGKAAGFVRNTPIALRSDILIALVAKDRKGGTEDTIKKFEEFHSESNCKAILL
jgi:hypothetical protein